MRLRILATTEPMIRNHHARTGSQTAAHARDLRVFGSNGRRHKRFFGDVESKTRLSKLVVTLQLVFSFCNTVAPVYDGYRAQNFAHCAVKPRPENSR